MTRLGPALIGIGLVLALLSGLADVIGVGAHPDFGWKQIVGLSAGTALLGAGIATARLDARGSKGSSPPEREPMSSASATVRATP